MTRRRRGIPLGCVLALSLVTRPAWPLELHTPRIQVASGDRELGEYLSAECVTCHQVTGQATGAIPPIIAIPDEQFVALMLSYKNRERPNAVMQTMAGRLSQEDIEALAAYFGSLTNQPFKN